MALQVRLITHNQNRNSITILLKDKKETLHSDQEWQLYLFPSSENSAEHNICRILESVKMAFILGDTVHPSYCRVLLKLATNSLSILQARGCFFQLDTEPSEPSRDHQILFEDRPKDKSENLFLDHAIKAMSEGFDHELEAPFHSHVPENRRIELEFASAVNRYIKADTATFAKIAQFLVLISLSICHDQESHLVARISAVATEDIKHRLLKAQSSHRSLGLNKEMAVYGIPTLLGLLAICEGRENSVQENVDPASTILKAQYCAGIVALAGTNPFGIFNVRKVSASFYKSQVFKDTNPVIDDIASMMMKLAILLPLPSLQSPSFPPEIIAKTEPSLLHLLSIHFTYVRQHNPRLTIANDDMMMLVLCSSLTNSLVDIVADWLKSGNGQSFYKDILRRVQKPGVYTSFFLLILFCCHHLLFRSEYIYVPQRGCFLEDFDSVLKQKTGSDASSVETLERMLLAVERVKASRNESEGWCRFLDCFLPPLRPVLQHNGDSLSDQYWNRRIAEQSDHEDAIRKTIPTFGNHPCLYLFDGVIY